MRTRLFRGLPVAMLLMLAPGHALLHAGETSAAAEETAERMLDAIGGRLAWSQLKNTINGSQQNRASEPTVVYAVITMDFEKPRFRIETTAQSLHVIRVIDGDRHWRLRRSGHVEDVPPELLKDDRKWYAAHLYRTIHRMAARDPEISLSINEKGRLEISAGKQRLLWFELDASGEPYAFGTWDDEVGSLTGPWDFVQDGIHHPRWVSSSDGTWRAAIRTLTINVPLSDQMFARPADE
jgi:hypothetical protein